MAATAEIQPISERRGETVRQIGRVREDGAPPFVLGKTPTVAPPPLPFVIAPPDWIVLKLGETSVAVERWKVAALTVAPVDCGGVLANENGFVAPSGEQNEN